MTLPHKTGLRALDSVLDEGSSHLKCENKLLTLAQAQERKAPLDEESTEETERKDRR